MSPHRDWIRNHELRTPNDPVPDWQKAIWKSSAAGLMLMILALVVLVAIMVARMLALLRLETPDNAFVFAGMTLISASLLRLLAILIGGAIAFVGLAVSFFAHQNATSVQGDLAHAQQHTATFALATNSPGIIAVLIGAGIIMYALYSKGEHSYMPGSNSGDGNVPSQALPPRDELFKIGKSQQPKRLDEVDKANPAASAPEK